MGKEILDKNTSSISETINKLTEREKESESQRRLLEVINGTAQILLAADEDDFESSLHSGMGLMAKYMNVDRIFIWKNEIREGLLFYTQRFVWLNKDRGIENSIKEKTGFSYTERIPQWEEKFSRGECVNSPVRLLSEREQKTLRQYGLVSILALPIYLRDKFWGFVSFDDCFNERTFSDDEINILRSGSLMLATAINRQEAALKMREADDRAKLMLDAQPLCCNYWNTSFVNIDCNEAAVTLFDLSSKKEYLDRFFELSPQYQPDGSLSSEKAISYIKTAFKTGRVVFEWMHRKLDGTPLPSEITLVRVKKEDGYIITGYTRDLRQYKKMMAEIEYKDALLRVVNDVAAILLQSDIDDFEKNLWQCMGMLASPMKVDRVYIWKNHTKDNQLYCTQLYEWSEGSDPQQGNEYTIDIPYSENAPGWEETLAAGKCVNGIVRHMSKAAQDQLAPQGIKSLLIVPVFLQEKFWGFVGVDDCTCERTFTSNEEAMMRSGGLLIANALLRNEMAFERHAAADKAQAASKAKSDFLSNMSHEMRTPMNAIIGMTAIAKSAGVLEKKNYCLRKIDEASAHLLGVINDILDMSKIEANKFTLSYDEFNFEKMLQKVVGVINFRVDEKHQDFSVHIDRDIPETFIGDDQRLSQVITNLLSNAAKFTPEYGRIRLDARLIKTIDDTCVVQFEVKDSGIGISAENQANLFTSFQQAESSTSRRFGGTGLGLAISKQIVDMMGGQIWVESEAGKGSTFTFNVQLKQGSNQPRNLLGASVGWNNVRILVADDSQEVLDYFVEILNKYNIDCGLALSGEDAICMMDENGGYDIYFVDWRMPGMNGIELTKYIKQQFGGNSVVIMISSTEWSVVEDDAKAAGVDKFLPKPLFPSTIIGCIGECIGQSCESEKTEEKEDLTGKFASFHMLLAEDMEINQEIVGAMLENTGISIDYAMNGVETIEMFKQNPNKYDLIFMDIQMPEMDGLEATWQIRALDIPSAKTIPIIAMTANVFREDIEKCLAVGMTDHLGKPLDFDDVFATIKKYVGLN